MADRDLGYDEYLALISERNVGRYDTSRLFTDPVVLASVAADYAAPFDAGAIDLVAGIDALGFVFATAVADELDAGMLPVRKGGKLPIPEEDRLSETVVDYTDDKKTLELDNRAVPAGAAVLVVDDWIETGAQMNAATDLIERAGGDVVGIAVLDATDSVEDELATDYRVHTLAPGE